MTTGAIPVPPLSRMATTRRETGSAEQPSENTHGSLLRCGRRAGVEHVAQDAPLPISTPLPHHEVLSLLDNRLCPLRYERHAVRTHFVGGASGGGHVSGRDDKVPYD